MARTIPDVVYDVSQGDRFDGAAALHVVQCWSCHITYAIPESLYRSAQKYKGDQPNGWKLCCPLGHTWWYVGETEIQRLKRQRDAARNERARERARRDQAEASARAHKGHATRLRKRAKAGVCPCCNRSFKQLRDHMQRMHPDFADEAPS